MGLFDIFRRNDQDDVAKELAQLKQRRNQTGTDTNTAYAGETGQLMVEDVFSITGRGTVVTGAVLAGSFQVGDQVEISRLDGTCVQSVITGIEAFRKRLDSAQKGDHVGLLLRGVKKNDIGRKDMIRKA